MKKCSALNKLVLLVLCAMTAGVIGKFVIAGDAPPASEADNQKETDQPHSTFAGRIDDLEQIHSLQMTMMELVKGEVKSVRVFRLPEEFLKTNKAKITSAMRRLPEEITLFTRFDGPADEKVQVQIFFCNSPEGAIGRLAGIGAGASAGLEHIKKKLSNKYGDVCIDSPRDINFVRGNILVRLWGEKADAVGKAATAFDDAIKASAELPAPQEEVMTPFEYPAELLTEKAREELTRGLIGEMKLYAKRLDRFAKYFTDNWDKESDASRAAFCELAGKAGIKEAIPLLVARFDFSLSKNKDAPPKNFLQDKPALKALIEIGMPSLEPAVARILKETENLPLNEDDKAKARKAFLHDALQMLITQILGDKLALPYLKIKLEDKNLSERSKAMLQSVVDSLSAKKTPNSIEKTPTAPGGNP